MAYNADVIHDLNLPLHCGNNTLLQHRRYFYNLGLRTKQRQKLMIWNHSPFLFQIYAW